MFSDKLCTILMGFDKIELNRMRKFVASPYFCDDEDVLKLFDVCHTALRKAPEAFERLTKEQVWQKIYSKQVLYDDLQLRRLASQLTQLAIQFRGIEQRQHEPILDMLDQQIALEAPELDKHLAGVERQMTRYFEEDAAKNTRFYYHQFRYHWQVFNRSYRVVAKTDYMGKLLPADYALECFYVVQKLKMYVAWLAYRQYRNTEREVPLPPGFWEHVAHEQFATVPMVVIFRKVVSLLNDPSEPLFFELLSDLDTYASDLAPEDLRECYFVAQNYCALQINKGQIQYYQHAFLIFKKMVDFKVLLEDESLAEGIYKNVITSGLRAAEYAWVERFIETHSDYLPVQIRQNARAFNLANLYSHLRQYNKALEVLRSVEYTDVTYALGAKTILLRVYYEQSEYMALDSLLDSFRIFLRRNKQMSTNLKKEYNTFWNLVKKLTTLRVGDKAGLAAFRQKVQATSYNTPKKWLLDKITELEK
jgi:hypothetical protein